MQETFSGWLCSTVDLPAGPLLSIFWNMSQIDAQKNN